MTAGVAICASTRSTCSKIDPQYGIHGTERVMYFQPLGIDSAHGGVAPAPRGRGFHQCKLTLQLFGGPPVVRVQERNVSAARLRDALIANEGRIPV